MCRLIVCWLLLCGLAEAQVLPLVAVISAEQELCGSATVIDHCRWPDGDRGFVAVTARHCVSLDQQHVARRENVAVHWEGQRLVPVTLICDCGPDDLALMYFVCTGRLPEPVEVAAVDAKPDEQVWSLGCDEGLIGRPDTAVVVESRGKVAFRSMYLVSGGRSGGCIVRDRQLVGIVTERSRADGRIGYAVPVSQVRRYVRQWYPLGNCPGGVCPTGPRYEFPGQVQQVPSTPPTFRSTVPAGQRDPQTGNPAALQQSCPDCDRRFGAIESRLQALEARSASDASQQVAGLRSELQQLSGRVDEIEATVPQAILDLRADVKRVRELQIPVRVLTPDGRVFSEEKVKLGDPIDFRLVPKTRKPDGGE